MKFPVGPGSKPHFYPPGGVINGIIQTGMGYPPLSLLAIEPGYLIGDIRYSDLAAMLIAAVLIAIARPSLLSSLSACLFLFSSRTFHVLYRSWPDPFLVAEMAMIVFAAYRTPSLIWLPFALLLATKQPAVLALPLIVLMVPDRRKAWLMAGKAVLVAGVITLPFFLLNPPAFWQS